MNEPIGTDPKVDITPSAIIINVSVNTLKESYQIDFSALVSNARKVNEPTPEPEAEPEGENDSDEEKPKKRQRRRDEDEEYDLADPFIDDAELPPGITLQELLAGNYDAVEQPVVSVKHDYYVWKGRLPERELDPLWEEKLMAVKKKSRKTSTKRRKSPERSSSEKSKSKRGKSPERSDSEKSKAKRARSPDKSDSEKSKVRRIKAPVKREKSMMERLADIGEADDNNNYEENDVIVEIISPTTTPSCQSASTRSPKKAQKGSKSPEKHFAIDSNEEKMRRKLDIATPLLELEYKLALEAFREESSKTSFVDPKRFPSNLRPFCNEVLVTSLRRLEKKTDLPDFFFSDLCQCLPFPVNALQKLIFSKISPLYRDELQAKFIPAHFQAIKDELSTLPILEGSKKARWNERIRELISEIIRAELDAQSLDRLFRVHSGIKAEHFSEISIRKALYQKIAACWPEGELNTMEIGKEYSAYKRKVDMKKLKDHGIEVTATLIPITTKPKAEVIDPVDKKMGPVADKDKEIGLVDKKLDPVVGAGVDPVMGTGMDPVMGTGMDPVMGTGMDPVVDKVMDSAIDKEVLVDNMIDPVGKMGFVDDMTCLVDKMMNSKTMCPQNPGIFQSSAMSQASAVPVLSTSPTAPMAPTLTNPLVLSQVSLSNLKSPVEENK